MCTREKSWGPARHRTTRCASFPTTRQRSFRRSFRLSRGSDRRRHPRRAWYAAGDHLAWRRTYRHGRDGKQLRPFPRRRCPRFNLKLRLGEKPEFHVAAMRPSFGFPEKITAHAYFVLGDHGPLPTPRPARKMRNSTPPRNITRRRFRTSRLRRETAKTRRRRASREKSRAETKLRSTELEQEMRRASSGRSH